MHEEFPYQSELVMSTANSLYLFNAKFIIQGNFVYSYIEELFIYG